MITYQNATRKGDGIVKVTYQTTIRVTLDIDVEVEADVTTEEASQLCGPPESCYEGCPAEAEINSIQMLDNSLVDLETGKINIDLLDSDVLEHLAREAIEVSSEENNEVFRKQTKNFKTISSFSTALYY